MIVVTFKPMPLALIRSKMCQHYVQPGVYVQQIWIIQDLTPLFASFNKPDAITNSKQSLCKSTPGQILLTLTVTLAPRQDLILDRSRRPSRLPLWDWDGVVLMYSQQIFKKAYIILTPGVQLENELPHQKDHNGQNAAV